MSIPFSTLKINLQLTSHVSYNVKGWGGGVCPGHPFSVHLSSPFRLSIPPKLGFFFLFLPCSGPLFSVYCFFFLRFTQIISTPQSTFLPTLLPQIICPCPPQQSAMFPLFGNLKSVTIFGVP